MPSFSYRKDYVLTAGLNNHDLDLSFLAAYKNPRVTMCDVVILTGTGTGLVTASLVDPNKTHGLALINTEPLWQPNVGTTWTGRVAVDWASWLRLQIKNAVAADKARIVLVIEHD